MNGKQSKKERQSAKKRAEREARIRAAKRRQKQRVGIVLGLLVAGVVGVIVLASGGSDDFDFYAGGGGNCGDAAPAATVEQGGAYEQAPPMHIDCDLDYSATIATNRGDIEIKLYDNVAPVTVNNFVALARDGFYDGLTFHRVIQDFMIQGGDPNGDGTGGPGYRFQDEFDRHKVFDVPYRLAMANSGPDTNGSQFFITVAPTPHLDQKHTVFGIVESGQEVVDEIATTETGEGDKPVDPVIIESITIHESAPEGGDASPSASPSAEGTES